MSQEGICVYKVIEILVSNIFSQNPNFLSKLKCLILERSGNDVDEESAEYNVPVDAIDTDPVYEDIASLRGREGTYGRVQGGVSSLFCWRVATATRVLDY